MRFLRKILLCGAVIALLLGNSSAFCLSTDTIIAYDNDGNAVYYDNGTVFRIADHIENNKQIFILLDDEVHWKAEGYEAAYPHAGYSRMYVYDSPTDIVAYNGLFPNWAVRYHPYSWQLYKEELTDGMGNTMEGYRIIQRQQSYIPGVGWTWDYGNESLGITDSSLVSATNISAHVISEEMVPYGFAGLVFCNGSAVRLSEDEKRMYEFFGVGDVDGAKIYESLSRYEIFGPVKLSERDPATGEFLVTDEMIRELIPIIRSKHITAKLGSSGNKGLETKSVAKEYLAHMNDGWQWNNGYGESFTVTYDADISWKEYLPESEYTYQCLVVNGVEMDGIDGKYNIRRYLKKIPKPLNPPEHLIFSGYDVTNILKPMAFYGGNFPGLKHGYTELNPVEPEGITYVAEGYETEYPYAGYSRMYIWGDPQNAVFYNNTRADYPTGKALIWDIRKVKRTDENGNVTEVYPIIERRQSLASAEGWKWDYGNEYFNIPDTQLATDTGRAAYVINETEKAIGIGVWSLSEKHSYEPLGEDILGMYHFFNLFEGYKEKVDLLGIDAANVRDYNKYLSDNVLNNEVLNKKNQDGTYLITDEFITSVLPVIYDTVVTAKLSEQGDEGLATRSFSEEYLRLSDNMCEWNTE
ncbi:MAG: hypothetical protein E7583_10580, partial [Ruminococcaceae bacterium]|nr:hypothetical protein [Oscillospiraceae bacterium]